MRIFGLTKISAHKDVGMECLLSLCAILLNIILRRDCLMMKRCNHNVHSFTNRRVPLLFRFQEHIG